MIRAVAFASFLCLAGCASSVTPWRELPDGRDGDRILLRGKLLRVSDNAVQICPPFEVNARPEDVCIDVIFAEGEKTEVPPGRTVVIEGALRRYSRDFVGIGFLTSRIGIIEGARLR